MSRIEDSVEKSIYDGFKIFKSVSVSTLIFFHRPPPNPDQKASIRTTSESQICQDHIRDSDVLTRQRLRCGPGVSTASVLALIVAGYQQLIQRTLLYLQALSGPVPFRANGEEHQVCEDDNVKVGPVWNVCKESCCAQTLEKITAAFLLFFFFLPPCFRLQARRTITAALLRGRSARQQARQ